MTPELSILMVTWNRLFYTGEAVRYLLEYTESDYELVIVDNGSSDQTKPYLKTLETTEASVKVLYNQENIGLAPALNMALENSSGQFVCFTANDLVVPEGWDTTLIDAYGKAESMKVGWVNPIVRGEVPWKLPKFEIEGYRYMRGPPVAGACGITERRILDQIGGFQSSGYLYGGVDGLTLTAIRREGYLTCWLENVEVVHLESGDRERYKPYYHWKLKVQANISKHSTEAIDPFEWQVDIEGEKEAP